jgi:antitoxin VapB
VNHERRIKLLRNGCDQVVQIPQEFELSGDEVILRASGDRLIFDTVKEVNLLSALRKLGPLRQDLPDED